jgi:hypothetical protein
MRRRRCHDLPPARSIAGCWLTTCPTNLMAMTADPLEGPVPPVAELPSGAGPRCGRAVAAHMAGGLSPSAEDDSALS